MFVGACRLSLKAVDRRIIWPKGSDSRAREPMQYTDRDGNSHWWLQHHDGAIIDLIYGLADDRRRYRHYGRGSPRAFMQTGYRRPSARAAEVMRRVEVARSTAR
jgi:hypothetical protein